MIANYIKSYSANLDGLREFVELIKPFLQENEKKVLETHSQALKPLEIAFRREVLDPSDPDRDKLQQELQQIFKGEIIFEPDEKEKSIYLKIKGESKALEEAFQNLGKATRQHSLLYQSALITLLSSVEWFFSQILHYYFDKFPQGAGIDDKTLTLSELKKFDSVNDAQNYLIDAKVDDILRSSFEDWVTILKSKAKLSMGYLEKIMEEMVEVYQRRNLLVHNGGVVNSIYLAKVKPELRQQLKVGEVTNVSPEYLEKAICMFELNFILISAELWKNLDSDDQTRSKVLMDIAFDHLIKERNDVCRGLSYFLMNDKKMPEMDRLIGQVNYWLSLKYSGRFDEVKSDIEQTDFTAKEPIFKLAQLCLLDNYELIFQNLPELLLNKQLKYSQLDTWPLFKQLREQKQYAEFKEAHKEQFENID